MLKPLEDRVAVTVIKKEEKTKGGIILTEVNKEKTQVVKVVEVGPGTEEIKMKVKKDDNVIIQKYAGIEIKYENNDLLIVHQKDILAIIE